MQINIAMRFRYAARHHWWRFRFWVRWKANRYIYRAIAAVLWRTSPRLRQEFAASEQRAWDANCASMDFGEWLGARIWA